MRTEVKQEWFEDLCLIDGSSEQAIKAELARYKFEVQRLRAENATYRCQFETTPISYFTIDRLLNIHGLNSAGRKILRYSNDQKKYQPFIAHINSADHLKIQTHVNTVMAGNKATLRTSIINDGKSIPVILHSTPTQVSGSPGFVCQTAMVDVSEEEIVVEKLQLANDNIHHTAYYDSLTGLPNRLFFIARLNNSLLRANNTDKKVALLTLDIDRFRQVNESLGHKVGDQLLKEVARRLKDTVRNTDTVARLGDDEFTVILEQVDSLTEVSRVATKIMKELAQPYLAGSQEIFTAASVGVSIYPTDTTESDELIRFSHAAMDHAKSRGSNRVEFFDNKLISLQRKNFEIERELRVALRESQFELYFQPQLSLMSNKIVGFEALLRWNHPVRGQLTPDSFIGIAERTGLIEALGEWILKDACQKLSSLRESGFDDIRISVNVSAKQFSAGNLQQKITTILTETNTPAHMLELELTESALLDDKTHTLDVLNKLRAAGIEFAIDDFGTGYSSFSRLRQLPLSRLKIDKSFVQGMPANQDDNAIVKAIISVAHEMGLEVVSEGVETLAQLEYLRSLKCDIVQGYYISRPVEFASALAALSVE